MGIISQITMIIGTIVYEQYCKDIEVRTMIYYSTWTSALSGLCSYFLASRLNQKIGVPDGLYIVFTDTIFGII